MVLEWQFYHQLSQHFFEHRILSWSYCLISTSRFVKPRVSMHWCQGLGCYLVHYPCQHTYHHLDKKMLRQIQKLANVLRIDCSNMVFKRKFVNSNSILIKAVGRSDLYNCGKSFHEQHIVVLRWNQFWVIYYHCKQGYLVGQK
jgi:hypothetical protein